MARSGTSRGRVTLDDVARAAGVSRSTASRVIAGYGPSSPAARDRVRGAALDLGYTPDAAARALSGGGGFRLVIAVTGMTPSVLDDPYVDRVVASAATVCARHAIGVSLQWLPYHAPGELRRLADDRGVRGALVVDPTEQILEAVPATLVGRIAAIGVGSRTVPSFEVDTEGAATAMTRHLCAGGRRRIAMVSGPAWLPGTAQSVDAYEAAMREAGLPARVVRGDFTVGSGRAAAADVLRRWPDTDAVLAMSDAMALGALAALRERGRDVPGDVAVSGFDDIPFAALSTPALTTATHPVERIAAGAASAVLDGCRGSRAKLYASELVRRESA
jgi:DNA-binding LacI/PurR family transcriptional regulator